jgi:hypothetical protein
MSEALADPDVTRATLLVAWVRESGLQALVPGLQALADRGGKATMLVGIDLQGTTRQGLELARRVVSKVYVVHDVQGRTFHPKIYVAVGASRGYALVGSNNATAAGLSFNYEGALACTFNPTTDGGLANDVDRYVRRLVSDTAICRRLSGSVLTQITHENLLGDERLNTRHRHEDAPCPESAARRAGYSPLFTASKTAKRNRIPPQRTGATAIATQRVGRSSPRLATAPDTWWKRLTSTDTQRPQAGNATGAVRMTKPPGQDVDPSIGFRRSFFGRERWRTESDRSGNPIDVATVAVDAWIDGKQLGSRTIRVDYAAHRGDRSRATTNIHWHELSDEVRLADYRGWYVVIERGPNAYRLSIQRARPA